VAGLRLVRRAAEETPIPGTKLATKYNATSTTTLKVVEIGTP